MAMGRSPAVASTISCTTSQVGPAGSVSCLNTRGAMIEAAIPTGHQPRISAFRQNDRRNDTYSRDRLACELVGEGQLCLDHRRAAFLISGSAIVSLGRSANLRYSAIDSKRRAFTSMVHLDIPCAAQ